MSERSIKNLMRGAMWLTIASLISKILSAIYRVPFQNMVGDVGFYIFQQVYPFYGIAMTFALGGFPVVISKMMAEAEGNTRRQQIILQSIYRTLRVVSILLFLFLFAFAYSIANMMGDLQLAPLIQTVSFVFLLTPQLAFLRGYFQGQDDMIPTAVSQTIEQLIRVGIIIVGAWLAVKSGQSLYTAGSMAMSGAFFGGLAAVLILRHFHKKRLSEGGLKVWGSFPSKTEKRGIAKAFLIQSLAICTVSAMLIIFQLLDSFQVYRLMIEGGIPDLVAKSLKGVYDRGQPILQLGLVLSTGLALALVPMITAARVSGERKKLERSVLLGMKLTLILSAAETVGLIVIMRPLNQMLFETSDGTLVLQLFMPAVFLSSLIIMTSSILQGFGKISVPAVAVLIGAITKCAANAFLVPRYATLGASLATCSGLFVILVVCYFALKQNADVPFFERQTIFNLCGALLVMCVFPVLWEWLAPAVTRTGSAVQAVLSVALGGGVFLIFALRYKLLTARDFTYLPFGARLLWLSQKVVKNK
ncbi:MULTISPECIES: polysaccharide biosynthesis protein [Listeria]|uniref:putative polysaccharide biosynthesis protein n=1 Tax=Listeria TaxID=1637 RepID=UPI000B5890C5|nr:MULTISPECIES: polysaccharide biosynthesis protein [Listeria]